MPVAVVTPYAGEAVEVLQRPCTAVDSQVDVGDPIHIIVGDGFPIPETELAPSRIRRLFVELPFNSNDGGATPRAVGTHLANSLGATGIAYLDADNSWVTEHLKRMVEAAEEKGCGVVAATRWICNYLSGERLYVDTEDSDGNAFADPNCIYLHGDATFCGNYWGWRPAGALGRAWSNNTGFDRIFWQKLKSSCDQRFTTVKSPTVEYYSPWLEHYAGENEVPESCKVVVEDGETHRSVWVHPTNQTPKGWDYEWL